MELALLIICGLLCVVTSLMVVFTRNTVHSAIWMIASFFFMAVLYLLLRSEFIAILQIIVYAGAIMMFIVYAIMMLNLRRDSEEREELLKTKVFGLGLLGVLFLVLLVLGVGRGVMALRGPVTCQVLEKFGETSVLANFLFSDYLLPFEVISLLLTAGVVGAVALAKKGKA